MLTNPTELDVQPAVRALTDYLDLTQGPSRGHAALAGEMVGVLIAAGHLTPPGRSSQRPAPALDDPASERDRWLLGDGEDDAEVWIPPRGDCVQFRFQQPCPHCDSIRFHLRTGRCADCGRRPGRGSRACARPRAGGGHTLAARPPATSMNLPWSPPG